MDKVVVLFGTTVSADEPIDYYKYSDNTFKTVVFDERFFSDILLEQDPSNITKYEDALWITWPRLTAK